MISKLSSQTINQNNSKKNVSFGTMRRFNFAQKPAFSPADTPLKEDLKLLNLAMAAIEGKIKSLVFYKKNGLEVFEIKNRKLVFAPETNEFNAKIKWGTVDESGMFIKGTEIVADYENNDFRQRNWDLLITLLNQLKSQ